MGGMEVGSKLSSPYEYRILSLEGGEMCGGGGGGAGRSDQSLAHLMNTGFQVWRGERCGGAGRSDQSLAHLIAF